MIHAITGLMNSGKTLYMTYLLRQQYIMGKKILSNYKLNFPHYLIKKEFMLYLGQEQPILENVAFGLDEFWIWQDARNSQSNMSRIMTYFFNQSSKDDTMIYFTAQHIGQADKRLRDNMHKLTECYRVFRKGNRFFRISDEQRFLPPNITKNLYIRTETFKRSTFNEWLLSERKNIKADRLFMYYNTKEKISAKKK